MELGMGDDPESVRRKKLLFRARNRGTREEGLLLGAFADRHLAGFDAGQLDRFAALLELADGALYDWVAGRAAPAAEQWDDVVAMLLTFRMDARTQ
jgi:antitoxin CptB